MSEWNSLSALVQGDLSFEVEQRKIHLDYAEIVVKAYSEKYLEFDFALEYFTDEEWWKDAQIVSASGNIVGNKIIGASASKYGSENILTWKFHDNNLRYGLSPKIRIKPLPRIRSFSTSQQFHMVTNSYGEATASYEEGSSNHICIGINNKGQAICVTSTSILIKPSPSSSTILYQYGWLLHPSYVYQKLNGNYIIADNGKDRIIELTEELAEVRTMNHNNPIHLDFSEAQETLLVTSHSGVEEFTWSDIDSKNSIWLATATLFEPYCATYKQDNTGKIAISDTGNNRIVLFDADKETYKVLARYNVSNFEVLTDEQTKFYKPYRVYWYADGDLCIIEQEGRNWALNLADDNSSSSSSSYELYSESSSSSEMYSESSSSSSSIDGIGFMYITVGDPLFVVR